MRIYYLLIIFLIGGCKGNVEENKTNEKSPMEIPAQSEVKENERPKIYSNKRFKDVTVTQKGDHIFLIKGKGQIFEASFGWVIEDGHNEIKEGFEMTDAGAPEWGNFSFIVEAKKERPNSTLHLTLFESSAMDGSRQHELSILLY